MSLKSGVRCLAMLVMMVLMISDVDCRGGASVGRRRKSPSQTCEDSVTSKCLLTVIAYIEDPDNFEAPADVITFLQSKTMSEHCANWNAIYDCFKTAAESSECAAMVRSNAAIPLIKTVVEAQLQFICVTRIADFQTHQRCLFDETVMMTFATCPALQSLNPMDCGNAVATIVNCANSALNAKPTVCQSGARTLVSDYVQQLAQLNPACIIPTAYEKLTRFLF